MAKEKFNILTSTCVPLPLENIDTDQIIHARFLKATTKEGFGDNLFRDWRYDKKGEKILFNIKDSIETVLTILQTKLQKNIEVIKNF